MSAAGAATSHIAKLKHTKSYAKTLNTQYENALEQLYMKEFGGVVAEYEHTGCCHRNQQRDEDSRKMLQEIFPPYLFYFLLFTGTIPQRRKAYSILTVAFWSLYLCFTGIFVAASVLTFLTWVRCHVDVNCEVSQAIARFDYASLSAFLLSNASFILAIIFAHTKLRDLLQSRAMMALISSVGTARIRKSTKCW